MGLYGLVRLGRQIDVCRAKFTTITDAVRTVDADENRFAVVDLRTLRVADGLQLSAAERQELERRLRNLTTGDRCPRCRGPILEAEPPRAALCLWCNRCEMEALPRWSPSDKPHDDVPPKTQQEAQEAPSVGTPVPRTPWGSPPSSEAREAHIEAVRATMRAVAKACSVKVTVTSSGGPGVYACVWGRMEIGGRGIEMLTFYSDEGEPPAFRVRQAWEEKIGDSVCRRSGPNHSAHTVEDAIALARDLAALPTGEMRCECSRCALRRSA